MLRGTGRSYGLSAIKYFDHDTVGEIVNANIAHDRGFFVGNHPVDLTPQITRLRDVLDAAGT